MAQAITIDKDMPVQEALKHASDLKKNGEMCIGMADDVFRQILPRIADGPERGKIMQAWWSVVGASARERLFFSQAGQDHWLEENVFKGRRGGTFVEIGAYDGVSGSNCLYFEMARGWSGFMVEPSPALMERARIARRVPGIECAVGPEEGEAEFLHVLEGYTQMSGLADHLDGHLKGVIRDRDDHREEILTVPVRKLDALLDEHGLSQVDYISLDVEGAEVAILEAFPHERYDITAWSVENNTGTPDIPRLMERAGYRLAAHIGVDQMFVRAD